jgi:chromosome partitioning protein
MAPRWYRGRVPLVLAVANLKGGVGKSTVALNLAAHLHHAGHRVLLVDTDGQGTCSKWAAVASESSQDGPPVVAVDGRSLRRDLDRVAGAFDVAILDTSPRLGAEVRAAMLSADLVLLPVIPGAADVWALRETVAVIEEAQAMRPELRVGVVLNRATRTTLTGVTRTALEDLKVPVLGTLGDRVAFGEATARGLGVVTYAPDSKAATEVDELVGSVLEAAQAGGGKRKRWRRARKTN